MYKSGVQDIHTCLGSNSDTPKYWEKWSKILAVEMNTMAVFDKGFRTIMRNASDVFVFVFLFYF